MNRHVALALCLLTGISPAALAEQNPAPMKQDSRIRVVPFDADNVVAVEMATGNALTIELPSGYEIIDVALSDTKFIQRATRNDNVVYLKAMRDVPTQPGFLKVRRPDGSQINCVLQLTAKEGANAPYLIRFTDPAADRAKAAAAWQARQAARRQEEASEALSKPSGTINNSYSVKGRPGVVAPPGGAPSAVPPRPAATVNESYSVNGHRTTTAKERQDIAQSLGGRY